MKRSRDDSQDSHPYSKNCDDEQRSQKIRSRYDARLINPGPPAVYQLNTERKYINGTDKKVRQWTYGRRDRNKQNKVLLMVGETGTGKTTLINTMINYILGVKFEDQEWYQITEEEKQDDQTQSQTSEITVYEVFVEENPTSLTIIDTPGYGDTEGYEKDGKISEYLSRLFSDKDGVHYIDAVCFVMKASQNRLSGKECYIFHAVQSLFGRDIEDNIVFLLTHSDGGPPTDALNAIEKAEIPCRKDEDNEPVHFSFNNRQKEKRNKRYEQTYRSAWETGEINMNELLTILEEKNRKSVQMTLDVLNERIRLEACVWDLKQRISEKESKTDELTQIKEALKQNKDKIKNCEDFQFTITKSFKEKVLIENQPRKHRKATCCSVCLKNCHEWDCSRALSPSWCKVMKNDYCTVCKCHYNKHVRENKKYVTKTKDCILSFDDLKKQYECNGDQSRTSFDKEKYQDKKKEHEDLVEDSGGKKTVHDELIKELEKIKSEKSDLLHQAYVGIMSLCKIALKADSAFTLQHLDFMIPRLGEEGKEEWKKNLEDLRKAGEQQKNKGALRHVKDFLGCLTDKK